MNLRRLDKIENDKLDYLKKFENIKFKPKVVLKRFKDLQFNFEVNIYSQTAFLSVIICEEAYRVNKKFQILQSYTEILVDMLYELEQRALDTGYVIPSDSGDYYTLIKNLIQNKRYCLS